MVTLLILQIIAHLLADFFFQSEKWCISKQQKMFRSAYLYWHILIVFITSWGASLSFEFLPYALFIAVSHFIIDSWKSVIDNRHIRKHPEKTSHTNPYLFLADQLLHLVIIYLAVWLFVRNYEIGIYLGVMEEWPLILVTTYLIVLKPSNILIRCVLSTLHLTAISEIDSPEMSRERKDLERAGRWIGAMERVLALTLVLLGQYTAIGFIIAAKSILRYGDKALRKTEYVLVGTLLSFGIAVLLGIAFREGIIEIALYYISNWDLLL